VAVSAASLYFDLGRLDEAATHARMAAALLRYARGRYPQSRDLPS
jgi:hypothetical protein